MRDVFRPNSELNPLATRIYDAIGKVQDNRKSDPNWIENEIISMWEITNRERAILGKGPVSLEKVKLAESICRGHIDYTMKCAFAFQDLVKK
jgi:hypothetical protein